MGPPRREAYSIGTTTTCAHRWQRVFNDDTIAGGILPTILLALSDRNGQAARRRIGAWRR